MLSVLSRKDLESCHRGLCDLLASLWTPLQRVVDNAISGGTIHATAGTRRHVHGLLGLALLAWFSTAAHSQTTATTLSVVSGSSVVNTVPSGSAVTLTATVAVGNAAVTLGQVNFCDAKAGACTNLGTAQLTQAGTAKFKFVPGVGSHTYKAMFAGTTAASASTSGTAVLTVTALALNSTVSAITQSGSAGNYTLTATVGGAGTTAPTGQVSFLDTSNGNTQLKSATLGADTTGLAFFNSSNVATNYGVAVGDFNGDGIPDLAAISQTDNTVGIMLGNGNGTFTATATSPTVGPGPISLAIGDFNSDGIPDLAVGNAVTFFTSNGTSLTVLLGQGDGTFRTAANIATKFTTTSIQVNDFNKDGKLDLELVSREPTSGQNNYFVGNQITILSGNGDGTFTTATTSPQIASSPLYTAVGDFNGDGIPDLATVNQNGTTVTVLLGNGDGTFLAAAASPATGRTPYGITVGDFNGDSIADLAVANDGDNTVTILLGKGDGSFTPSTVSLAANTYPVSIGAGDFNGDGIADLAVTGSGSAVNFTSVTVLLGNGNGTFTAIANGFPTNYSRLITTADFNGDGKADLAAEGIVFLAETQTATATATGVAVLPAGSGTHQVTAAYAGDTNYSASTSVSTGLTAVVGTPTLNVSAANPASYGSSVSLMATAVGSGATPTGSVIFYDEGGQLGTGTLNNSGTATFVETVFQLGTHAIYATYGGDSNYTGVTSAVFNLTVNKGAPTANLSSSASSATYGTTVSFTAALTSGGANPTGTVTFFDGTNTLGTGTLNLGVASYSSNALALGSHTITAGYGGDKSYNAVTSSPVTVSITAPIGTSVSTLTVTPSATSITYQQSVSVTITVAGSSGQATPTGTVTLGSGSYSAQQTLSSGTSTFTIAAGTLSAGANTLNATYAGDATYARASGTSTVTVSPVVIAIPAPSPVSAGRSATATASLSAASAYAGTMNLNCKLTGSPSNAQSLPTCSLNPSSVTIPPGGSGTTVLTVQTTAATKTAGVQPFMPQLWKLGGGGTILAGLLMIGTPSRRRRISMLILLLGGVVAVGIIGCGSGGNGGATPSTPNTPATTAGSYTFSVTGTDSTNSNISISANVSVTVQ